MELTVLAILAVSILFLLRLLFRPGSRRVPAEPLRRKIAVDGTNVMFWRDNTAQLSTLQSVLDRLRRDGFDPVVFLDASTRHHIGDRSMDETKFAAVLGLASSQIMVCPARTEADAFILEFASDQKLAVVTNDRFRDRPTQARNVRLVKGGFNGERLFLKNLPPQS